jgi:hypothetical protein
MNQYMPVFAALAVSLVSSAFVPSLKAGESDKRTTITISQPVDVQGTILPAGQYVLTLLNSVSSRDVVCIFNGDGTRLITEVLAIHAQRLQPTERSEFAFYGATAGQPVTLHTWFYPGDESGFEFLQSERTSTKPTRSGHVGSPENLVRPASKLN